MFQYTNANEIASEIDIRGREIDQNFVWFENNSLCKCDKPLTMLKSELSRYCCGCVVLKEAITMYTYIYISGDITTFPLLVLWEENSQYISNSLHMEVECGNPVNSPYLRSRFCRS